MLIVYKDINETAMKLEPEKLNLNSISAIKFLWTSITYIFIKWGFLAFSSAKGKYYFQEHSSVNKIYVSKFVEVLRRKAAASWTCISDRSCTSVILRPAKGRSASLIAAPRAGNHHRVRIPQKAGGGNWMLWIPVQICAGYSYQHWRQGFWTV